MNVKPVPSEKPHNSVEIVQTVEKVIEPSSGPVIESNTLETVTTTTTTTTTETTGPGAIVQTTETHEIKAEINSQSDTVPNGDGVDNNKLSEPENNEMTGRYRF